MSQPINNQIVNPNAIEDPEFIALRDNLQSSQSDSKIEWERVFNLDRESFLPDNAEILHQIVSGLESIESKDYGQQLFQDIVMNENRIEPVAIRADSAYFSSPALYMPGSDSIIYNTQFYEIVEQMPESMRQKTMQMITSISLDDPAVWLLHEGDHAARTYGADMPPLNEENQILYNISFGCIEEQAINRANQYREEIGVPPRTDYAVIDEQLDSLIEMMRESNELQEIQREGMPADMYKDMATIFTILEARNSGCEGATVTEIEGLGKQHVEKFLAELGVTKVAPEETKTSQDDNFYAPDHGLPPVKEDTSAVQNDSFLR
jgi:hypothetical protein